MLKPCKSRKAAQVDQDESEKLLEMKILKVHSCSLKEPPASILSLNDAASLAMDELDSLVFQIAYEQPEELTYVTIRKSKIKGKRVILQV